MTLTPDENHTTIIARTIEADPQQPKPAHDRRPLADHASGVALTWSASMVVAFSLLALIFGRLTNTWFQHAALVARIVAPPWPGSGDPSLWPKFLAVATSWLALLLVLVAIAKLRLPRVVTLVGSIALAAPLTVASWSTISVINGEEWTSLPACAICVIAWLLALWAGFKYATRMTSPKHGAIYHILGSVFMAAAVLLLGTQGIVAAEKDHGVPVSFGNVPTSSPTPSPVRSAAPATALRQLALRRSADAKRFPELRGHWAVQVQSVNRPSEGTARSFLISLRGKHFTSVVVTGRDLELSRKYASEWIALAYRAFTSKKLALSWCRTEHLRSANCLARTVPPVHSPKKRHG